MIGVRGGTGASWDSRMKSRNLRGYFKTCLTVPLFFFTRHRSEPGKPSALFLSSTLLPISDVSQRPRRAIGLDSSLLVAPAGKASRRHLLWCFRRPASSPPSSAAVFLPFSGKILTLLLPVSRLRWVRAPLSCCGCPLNRL